MNQDLTGLTFGKLTVVRLAYKNEHRANMWECRCSCPEHKLVYVSTHDLIRGHVKSCGCRRYDMLNDLTGKTFGRWTVIKRVSNSPGVSGKPQGFVRYLCRCSCEDHTEKIVLANALKTGTSKSCGCLQKETVGKLRFKDLTGKTFGKLKVLRRVENAPGSPSRLAGTVQYECQCSCPDHTICIVRASSLLSGLTQSCGCIVNKWKDDTERLLVARLEGMKGRCYNPNEPAYKNYGGRGIFICDEWMNGDEGKRNFIKWSLENGFRPELSIDRIDNNGPYAPWNCRWTDQLTQANNTRKNIVVDINGERHTIAEWARLAGVDYYWLRDRLHKGYELFKGAVLYNMSLKRSQ